MTIDVEFEHYGRDQLDANTDAISILYEASHQDVADKSFYDLDRFIERIRSYSKAPRFEFVIGRVGDEPVGLALGYALPVSARWWAALTTPIDPELIEEDGTRTFALCELMTHPDWQGKGVGHQLHDEILHNRSEQRGTLLVREDNQTARRAYEKWGWRQVGKIQPGWPDAPHFDALLLDLATK